MVTLERLFLGMVSLAETWILIEFVSRMLSFKKYVKKRNAVKISAALLLSFLLHLEGKLSIPEVLLVLLAFVFVLVYSSVFLKQGIWIKLFWVMAAGLLVSNINIFFLQILSILNGREYSGWGYRLWYDLLILLSKVLFGYISYKIYKTMEDKELVLEKDEYRISMVLLGSLFLLESYLFYLMEHTVRLQKQMVLLGISVILILLDGIVGKVLYRLHISREQSLNMQFLYLQNQELKRQNQILDDQQERIRKLRHDYQNHFTVILSLLKQKNYEEAVNYIEDIEQTYLDNRTELIKVNHPVIQAVLNAKLQVCMEKQIKIRTDVTGDLSAIKGMEVSVILVNLLDNAIEAAQKQTKKEISVEISMEENYLYMLVSNGIDCSVLDHNPDLASDKGEEHGYGLKNIKEILKMCDGTQDVYEDNGEFLVRVMIPVGE